MIERVSLTQTLMAGSITGFGLAALGGFGLYAASGFSSFSRAGPLFLGMILMVIPLACANACAWLAMRITGGAMPPLPFHLVLGGVAGVLLILLCDLISRGAQTMGGGPISGRTLAILAFIGAANALMVFLTWRFNWQPQRYS